MTSLPPQLDKLFAIAEPVCLAAGYELIDVRLLMEPMGWVLRVFIDRLVQPGDDAVEGHGEAIGLADCERMSRELGAVLDVEDPIPQAYSLEVSSPGIDRPLRTAAHFRRFVGETAKIALRHGVEVTGPAGDTTLRRNYKGPIVSVDPTDAFVVVDIDGTHHHLPIDDIDTARLIPDWDAVLGIHPKPGKPGKSGKSTSGGKKQATKQADR
jgi:ribosome maturation factor RimP